LLKNKEPEKYVARVCPFGECVWQQKMQMRRYDTSVGSTDVDRVLSIVEFRARLLPHARTLRLALIHVPFTALAID